MARSPEQLNGVLDTLSKLMGSQLGGLRRQFKASTGGSDADFNAYLSPRAIKMSEGLGDSSVPPEALSELKKSPTAEMKKHFDEVFGEGSAEKALAQ